MRVLGKSISFFNVGVLLFLILCLLIYSPTALTLSENALLTPIVVPYVVASSDIRTVYFAVFSVILLFYGLSLRGHVYKNVDMFLIFLICRLFLAIIQVLICTILNKPMSLGNYFQYVIEFFFYLGCVYSLRKSDEYSFFIIIKFVVMVVAIETIVQSFFGVLPTVPYTSLSYKVNMRIPCAGSNAIGVLILPLLTAELFANNKTKLSWAFILICTIAIVLTKSRWTMFLLLCAYLKFSNFIKHGWGSFFIAVMLIVFVNFAIDNYDMIMQILLGFSDEVSTGGTMNKLSSGRETLMEDLFNMFLENPIIGVGPLYEESRGHNIVVDILYQNGIIGLFIFFLAIYSIYYKFSYLKKKHLIGDKFKYVFIVAMVFLIQSLGEISYFTSLFCDVFFFTSLAFLNRNLSQEFNSAKRMHKKQYPKYI